MDNNRLARAISTKMNIRKLAFSRSWFLDRYELWLFIVASGIAIFLRLSTPFHYNANSEQSLKMAWYLLGDERGEYFYYRTPGFPLFLIVTGVAFFERFWGLIAVHVVMTAFIPILIYRSLFHFNRDLARICAIIILISVFPFLFMSKVIIDQGVIFYQFWALYYFSRFLQTCSYKHILWLTLLLFILSIYRPAASLMIVPSLLVFCLIKPLPWKYIIFTACIFAILTLGHSVIRAKIINPPGQWEHTAAV